MLSRTLGLLSLSNDKPHYPSILTLSCVLPDDVLIEIFLRLPPQSSFLIRVAIVCKHWHSLIVSHPFLCRFQMFQRTPLLGIFTNSTRIPRFLPVGDPPDCVAAAAAAFSLPDLHWYALGCRGNNVLLSSSSWVQLLVMNPINGDQRIIPAPPDLDPNYNYGCVPERNAAVLCAAGHADRGCCQSCPFFVVCVFSVVRFAYATRYSSETQQLDQDSITAGESHIDTSTLVSVN